MKAPLSVFLTMPLRAMPHRTKKNFGADEHLHDNHTM
jgi:hypothetical protein